MGKKLCYLIGYPVGHSISPAMHNAAFNQLDLDREYSLLEIKPDKLKDAINVLREPDNIGFNVTIPHKQAVMEYIDMVTELAEKLGAVNTVKIQDEKLIGYNTDGPGFIDSLKQDINFNPAGKNIILLGAGGAGSAVAMMLADSKIKKLTIQEPRTEQVDKLLNKTKKYYPTLEVAVSSNLQKDIDNASLLVNATPVGMHPKVEASPLPTGIKLHPKLCVYDLVYMPEKTLLMQQAESAGAKAFSGLGMLVRQGALSFTLINGTPAPYRTMYRAARLALQEKRTDRKPDTQD
ncbi:shikimate dehydrogenase [Candidatus Margulisiibacteriota bacterium]